jgi:transcriptional regulator with XRE-family HTH domain
MYRDLIREQREKLGLNQGDLAEKLQAEGMSITRAAVSHWENGRNPSPLDSIRDILILARVLNLDLTELLQIADNQIAGKGFGEAAQSAALIVEDLTLEAQQIALEQLRALQKHFPEK